MSVRFLGTTSSAAVGAGITLATPSRESLKEADLLFGFVLVQDYTVTTLTSPAGWVVEPAVTVGDQAVFPILHYVADPEDEPTTYAFTYAASKPIIAVLEAYRGVKQDILYDPSDYPFGYYAPGGSPGGARTQTGVASVASLVTGPSSFKAYSRALYFFGATHGSGTPHLSDPLPFAAVRSRVYSAKASCMLVDVLEVPEHVSPLPSISTNASVTLTGSIGLVRVLEPVVEADDSYDSYKAKLFRKMIPPPFKNTWESLQGQLSAAIGEGDNQIGGLFGDADFLPDEVT